MEQHPLPREKSNKDEAAPESRPKENPTMDRFRGLVRRLLGASASEVRDKERELREARKTR
jgi:hypothetical protein